MRREECQVRSERIEVPLRYAIAISVLAKAKIVGDLSQGLSGSA